MNRIDMIDQKITDLKALRNEALMKNDVDGAEKFTQEINAATKEFDKAIEEAAIADDGWSNEEIRSMNGERC